MTMENGARDRGNGCGCGGTKAASVITRGLSLTDPPPLLSRAVDSCMESLTRLAGTVGSADNPAHQSRDSVKREARVDVDANPYRGVTREKIEAVVRAAYHSRAMPEVLLAKWAKEGSTSMTVLPQTVTQATTVANARTILRSTIFYLQLGVDWLTVTHRPDPHGDNVLDDSNEGAPAQERHFAARVAELVHGGFLAEDISAAVNAELTVTSSGGTFSVQPSTRFYALSLLLADAVFAQFLAMTFPQLPHVTEDIGYMLWNMGEKRFAEFLKSADKHRRDAAFIVNGGSPSIEQWALHTNPKENEYGQARRNAIRFAHYIRAYRPVFRNAMTLIKPGIEDLRGAPANAASFEEDPLGVGSPAPVANGARDARAMTTPVPGGGHGSFRHAPLGGADGDNVELRWNLPAGTTANATIDIVVHLHGYGARPKGDARRFIRDKTTLAGVGMVDSAGNANVRASRPTLAIVPRGRFANGPNDAWVFDNLPDARAFDALVDAGLAWLASSGLHLQNGASLRRGRLTLMAHSGGGAAMSALLSSGLDPDELVCFDSMYGGEAPIIAWAQRRIASRSAASYGLRVFYTGCGRDSWRWGRGAWRLVTTEVSARRLQNAIDTALGAISNGATLAPRYRVERTSVAHLEIPARYTPTLLDDVSANVTRTTAPPPASERPDCCANANWLTHAPQHPGGDAPPPEPPAAHAHDYDTDDTNGHAYAASAPNMVIDYETYQSIAHTRQEPSGGGSWMEVASFSQRLVGVLSHRESYAAWKAPIPPSSTSFVKDDPANADGFLVRLRGRLVVPNDLASRSRPVPLVVLCMGNHPARNWPPGRTTEIPSHTGYDYLQQALADAGYASISVDTNPANDVDGGIRMRAEMILATVQFYRTSGAPTLRNKIDFGNVGLVGHSRGGEAVVFATKLNATSATPLGIRSVASIAPTDWSRGVTAPQRRVFRAGSTAASTESTIALPLALSAADHVRYLVLYGSNDGDVSGDGDSADTSTNATREGQGISLYDRATCAKTLVFARGITHNRFNTVWNECADYGDGRNAFVDPADCRLRSSAAFDSFIFSAEEHRNLALFYIGAFLDVTLKGDASKESVLDGRRAINARHAIALDFAPADRLVVDDFAVATNPRRTRTGGSFVDAFTILHCPHDTKLFEGNAGNKLRVELPPATRDLRRRASLTMRVGARYPVTDIETIRRAPKPTFTVRLETSRGVSPVTDGAISTAGVLTPDRPFFNRLNDGAGNVTKLHLDTVVIPLSAFRGADLADVRAIEVEVGRAGTTPMLLDSIAFV